MGYMPYDYADAMLQAELEVKIVECERIFNEALKEKIALKEQGKSITRELCEKMVNALLEMVECYKKLDSNALDFNKEKANKANKYLSIYTSLLNEIQEREEENER